ncbi:MAG TPA: hypothetical protein VJP80_01900 [Candidatus Saccharimonadales bacterium]|nr:hypothetical protein [Candidatus Saccharimonadales bacterium]
MLQVFELRVFYSFALFGFTGVHFFHGFQRPFLKQRVDGVLVEQIIKLRGNVLFFYSFAVIAWPLACAVIIDVVQNLAVLELFVFVLGSYLATTLFAE